MNLNKWECDRCHRITDRTNIQEINFEYSGLWHGRENIDLCKFCMKEFGKFVNMKVKVD